MNDQARAAAKLELWVMSDFKISRPDGGKQKESNTRHGRWMKPARLQREAY